MDTERESLIAALRDKAGDGSTDFRVELWQSDLAALLAIHDALIALVERVETDESVGVCLSSRVESLNAMAAIGAAS